MGIEIIMLIVICVVVCISVVLVWNKVEQNSIIKEDENHKEYLKNLSTLNASTSNKHEDLYETVKRNKQNKRNEPTKSTVYSSRTTSNRNTSRADDDYISNSNSSCNYSYSGSSSSDCGSNSSSSCD